MSQPIVSVNICMYNSSRYIDETLRGVFAQTLQDFEIVVVDDGSTDGSPELIEQHYRDPRITVVRQPHQTLRIARSVASTSNPSRTPLMTLDPRMLSAPAWQMVRRTTPRGSRSTPQ